MSNRIALWDNLKFILITLVVGGHFSDQLTDYSSIYSSIFLFIYALTVKLCYNKYINTIKSSSL